MIDKSPPRIVLITNGMRPIAEYFATLPGIPVGVINWNDQATQTSGRLSNNRQKNKLHALVRKRKYASLEHLCTSHKLLYTNIHKHDIDKMHSTLTNWKCDLAITSSCSIVPALALPPMSHGAINLHPSWLPDYRGGEPLLWHILEGQKEIAASVHRLTDKYDSGAVLAQERTTRPPATSKVGLNHITENILGHELLTNVIEFLIANPNTQGSEQPRKSPTRFANVKTPAAIANEIHVDSLAAQSLWDLIHYFGYCPPDWLGLTGWRKHVKWRPARFLIQKTSTDSTKWNINTRGAAMFLQNDHATIELRPMYSSLLGKNGT